jgi:hypothetical protein
MRCATKVSVLTLWCLSFAIPSFGQTLSVTIDGTTKTDATHSCNPFPTGATKCVNIAGDTEYPNLKIEPISSTDNARVVVMNDSAADTLNLVNAKITAQANIPGNNPVHLIFQYQHGPNPTINYYKASAYGTFSNTAGNAISIKAMYTGNDYPNGTQIGTTKTHTVSCNENGCTTLVNLTTTTSPTQLIPGSYTRTLNMDSWVTMANGSTLNLNGTGLKVWSSSVPDPQPCVSKASLGITCASTYSTAQAFGCPSCVLEDQKVTLFARANWESLSQDMAQGQGEHLASFAELLHVPAVERLAFFALAQERYTALAQSEMLFPDQVVTDLQDQIAIKIALPSVSAQPGN